MGFQHEPRPFVSAPPSSGAFIDPPPRAPLLLRLGTWLAERMAGKKLLPARILAWYPRAALGAGVLEATTAHVDGRIDRRMLKLVRLAASFATACPFCADMNAHQHREAGVSDEELEALRTNVEPQAIPSLSDLERLAVRYARLTSQTPLRFPADFVTELRGRFGEREIVVLATTAAQVNYWARLVQSLGIPPAGFYLGQSHPKVPAITIP
jgi:AhpD family alkylhydroperoxidase